MTLLNLALKELNKAYNIIDKDLCNQCECKCSVLLFEYIDLFAWSLSGQF